MSDAEYRDPDGHMADNGDYICNRCDGIIWSGKDGWVCDCDSATYEYARPEP